MSHVDVYWREFIDGIIPEDAVLVESNLYIGQMPVNGLLPGTIYPNSDEVISEFYRTRVISNIAVKILCSKYPERLKWDYVNIENVCGDTLYNSVRGGIEKGVVLYIGKTFHEGRWKIGKIFPAFHQLRGLRIWTNSGHQHVAEDFQILKYYDYS